MISSRVLAGWILGLALLTGCGAASESEATGGTSGAADTTDTVTAVTIQTADSVAIDTLRPSALAPDTSQPDTSQPDTSQPDTSQPDTRRPAASAEVRPRSAARIEALLAALEEEVAESRAVRDSLRAALAVARSAPPASAAPSDPSPDAVAPASDTAGAPAGDVSGDAAPAPAAESDDASRITLEEAKDTARSFGLRAAFAVMVLVLTFFTIKGVAYVLETLAERSAERRLLYKRIVPIARVLLWAVALYAVLRGIFEVDAQGLLAAAAAIGVAVGFAAQDLLKNIFGGLVIIFDTPFQVGDKISVGGTYGEVIGIGLRSTRIVTPDDNLVSVPNSQIVDGQVSNANAGALDCQVVTDLYLPGWVDEAKAKRIAYQAAVSSKYVYLKKNIAVIVKDEFDDGHVLHLKVKAYVLDTRYEFLLMSDVTERARVAFRREGLLLPATRAYVDLYGGNGASVPADVAPPEPPADSSLRTDDE